MMDRRAFIAFTAAAMLVVTAIARAQRSGDVFRIGYLALGSGPGDLEKAFREGLRELGYGEGRDIALEFRWASGKLERLPELVAELLNLKVDVIVASATRPIEAAKRATSTIPIVMAAVDDPVGSGLVASLARPGGNVTGLTLVSPELAGKRLQLIRELIPKVARVAVLALPQTSSTTLFLEELRPVAQQMGIQIVVHEVNEASDLPRAFASMQREGAQALVVQVNPLTYEHHARVAALAAQYRLASMYEVKEFVDAGGLVCYGPSLPAMYRRAAFYVDRILKGATPGDLPVEQPTKFELVINLKTAKALGLTIPPSLLQRADQVIDP
jgi:putative tryptophan/tyrosine transport system substrate-binding protein